MNIQSITVTLYYKIVIDKYEKDSNTRNGGLFSKHLLSAYRCRGWEAVSGDLRRKDPKMNLMLFPHPRLSCS